jgi:hypothetical protein
MAVGVNNKRAAMLALAVAVLHVCFFLRPFTFPSLLSCGFRCENCQAEEKLRKAHTRQILGTYSNGESTEET